MGTEIVRTSFLLLPFTRSKKSRITSSALMQPSTQPATFGRSFCRAAQRHRCMAAGSRSTALVGEIDRLGSPVDDAVCEPDYSLAGAPSVYSSNKDDHFLCFYFSKK